MRKHFLAICLLAVVILTACSSGEEATPSSEIIESTRPTSEIKPDTPVALTSASEDNSFSESTPDIAITETPVQEASSSQHLQYIFDTPSDSITVVPSPDSQRWVEAIITDTGGTLSATGADGTTYTLEIPSGALVVDTLIQMTPLNSLEGMPFGSESFAVQIEPAGL